MEAHVLVEGVSVNTLSIWNTGMLYLGPVKPVSQKDPNSNDLPLKIGSSIPSDATNVPSRVLKIIPSIVYQTMFHFSVHLFFVWPFFLF